MRILFLFFVSFCLCSCMSYQERMEQNRVSNLDKLSSQARFRDTIPVCDPDNCQRKWDAAQAWVSQNSEFKIQTVSSAIIETYNPLNGDTRLAFSVTKMPVSDGKYQIVIKGYCANWVGCRNDPLQAVQQFNDYINSFK